MILERFPELSTLPQRELVQLAWEILDGQFTFGDEETDRQIGEAMMARYNEYLKNPAAVIPWEQSLANLKRKPLET